ncbi:MULTISPECIES: DUF4430 domain-containing protein [Lactobacillaceae]|uniref:DUF4430 domain-containing protein n=1 Tax=Lactobacillaceae TaxID=33958 RepID=UPI000C1B79E1|nr:MULTISPECIES: DUF4430 domain-containing protein [Lactobacillaceae]
MYKKIVTVFMTLALLFTTGVSATNVEAKKSNDSIHVTYVLKDGKKQIAKKKITLKKNSSVMTGVKKGWTVKEKDGFITSIDGHKQNEKKNKYWTFTVNKKQVNVGAKDKKLKNKDNVEFKLDTYKDK